MVVVPVGVGVLGLPLDPPPELLPPQLHVASAATSNATRSVDRMTDLLLVIEKTECIL